MRLLKYLNEKQEFTALVKNKQTKELTTITSIYRTKKEFIEDLKANGYVVYPKKVKTKKEFDRIMNTTNANEWDWKGMSKYEYLDKQWQKIHKGK